MSERRLAKLFQNGSSQAVRLPKAFRFPGDCVRISRVGNGVLLEPVFADAEAWLAELERYRRYPFMENGREQPDLHEREPLE
jgi:antitoxin VapB